MQRYELILYDLDGTLIDSFEGIARSLNGALEQCGLPTHSLERVKSFVGDGVEMLVRRALGEGAMDQFDRALRLMTERYLAHPAAGVEIYPGVVKTLREVGRRGIRQAIVTNKPHEVARACCGELGLASLVDGIEGAREDAPLKPDPRVARRLMNEFNVAPERCAVIGDGVADIELARATGATALGCAWGTQTRKQMVRLGPDRIFDSIEDLIPWLDE